MTRTYGKDKGLGVYQYPDWRSPLRYRNSCMESDKQQQRDAAQSLVPVHASSNVPPPSHGRSGARKRGIYVACLSAMCVVLFTGVASAAVYSMPPPESNIIGTLQVVTVVNPDTTLLDIARHFDLGYAEITAANPTISTWVPKVGAKIIISTEFILPPGVHKGIVVNIPQRRLYYFPEKLADNPAQVITFPISIAREGWKTPLGNTRIIAKFRDPSWVVPKSIQKEHIRDGERNFPRYFAPGPDNPMGMLALQTGYSGIFIHGTNRPWGVGMRTSHGCLHLYPEDAAYLFARVNSGTPVRFIDQPYTVGIRDSVLYLSSSEPVTEYSNHQSPVDRVKVAVHSFTTEYRFTETGNGPAIDWPRVYAEASVHHNLPIPISLNAPALKPILESIHAEPYTEKSYPSSANNALAPTAEE